MYAWKFTLFSLEEFLYPCHGNLPHCHQYTHNITNVNDLLVFQIQSFVERNDKLEKKIVFVCRNKHFSDKILLNIR